MIRAFLTLIILILSAGIQSPLARATGQIQEPRVLVVLIFDQNCHAWCEKVRPLMRELKQQYGEKVDFTELDVSQATLKQSVSTAKGLGVFSFLRDSADWVPIVGVFSSRRKLVKELVGPKPKEAYAAVIDKALEHR